MAENIPSPAGEGKPRSPWRATPTQNLVIYEPAGTYYVRARFGSKTVREKLAATDYADARDELRKRLGELRKQHAAAGYGVRAESLHGACADLAATIAADPALKASTREFYRLTFERLKGDAALPPGPIKRVSHRVMAEWWARVAKVYAPQGANHVLMLVRRAVALQIKRGGISHDPTEELKRVRIQRTRLKLPTAEQFRAIVASVRASGREYKEEAADWLEFMAYSGMRPAEIAGLRWEDIGADVIRVTGGDAGTKNHLQRPVPIIPPMADLLARMTRGTGGVFAIRKPTHALANATARLEMPPLRIYDLRHLFATTCIEKGVDVATVAAWLGHQDGGALAMRTYVQNRDEHGQRMAERVVW